MAARPVIAIAGLGCETSTFTPSRTTASAFHPQRGIDIIRRYPFLHDSQPLGREAAWKGALIGHAIPGGVVGREAFETLAGEIVSRLGEMVSHGNIDGLWFDIHGAMCVEDMDDAEAELLRRIRRVIGPRVLVSASMDLHGNVSEELARLTDLITCYRFAPHTDVLETKARACRNLVDLVRASPDRRPWKAWIPIPILLPGEQTSTRIEPAKHIYAAVPEVEASPGVLDAAIWVGYPWADEPRNRAVVMVTGWNKEAVSDGAMRLAKLVWDARGDFKFVAPTGSLAECLDAAVACPREKRPFFISDSGDNPTAGGSGDVTWGLTALLDRPEFKAADSGYTVIYASLPGPKAVDIAVAAGLDKEVTVTAGAEADKLHAPPVTMTGVVHAIKHGDRDAEPYHKEKDFTDLRLDPRRADIVVVKIGYLEPELYDMAKGWRLALTPGSVDQDLQRLGHKRIQRPMWPFDKTFDKIPDLSTRWIGSVTESPGKGDEA